MPKYGGYIFFLENSRYEEAMSILSNFFSCTD
jgi:hypothetical protein